MSLPLVKDDEISEAIQLLETRKQQLKKIITLRQEVAALESDAMAGSTYSAAIRDICEIVCAHYRVSFDVLMSRLRTQEVAMVRHIVFYIARELTKASLDTIGKIFARDHGTILHGYKHVCDRKDVDKNFYDEVRQLVLACADKLGIERHTIPETLIKKWEPKV